MLQSTSKKRFAQTTASELQQTIANSQNQNTLSKSKWAMNVFRKWFEEWRVRIGDDINKVLKNVEEFTKNDLDYCLRYFYSDARKENGEFYPPDTLKDICTGIQYFFNNSLEWQISLFNDPEFCLNLFK